jgi:hypothetical protein
MPNTEISNPSVFVALAESLGEALGRGVARGINSSLSNRSLGAAPLMPERGPGRPARLSSAAVSGEKRCKAPGCANPARSKGLCSKHYQAERRRQLGA